MQGRRLLIIAIAVNIAILMLAGTLHASQIVTGTLQSWAQDTISVKSDASGRIISIKPEPGAVILRGQTGKDMKKAALLDFAPGDRVVAVVKQSGEASSLKAFYSVVRGTITKAQSNKLFLSDGSTILLRPGLQIISSEGKMVKPENIKSGSLVLCRLNPATKEAWTVVATQSQPDVKTPTVATKKSEPKPVNTKPQEKLQPKIKQEPIEPVKVDIVLNKVPPVAPASVPDLKKTTFPEVKPTTPEINAEIKSIQMSGPWPLKVKDWFRVDMEGTPAGVASCYVKGLIPVTTMAEISPGKYRASIMIPGGKPVKNAALIGRLTVGNASALPVQASKLVSIDTPEKTIPVVAQPLLTAAVPPAPQQPLVELKQDPLPEPVKVEPKPEPAPAVPAPPKVQTPIFITSPLNETKIQRVISIKGTAEPGSNVIVRVKYSNGLGGILKLTGQVSSQLVAVKNSGQFDIGPIPLEGSLATKGLIFSIEVFYPEKEILKASVRVIGDRS